ncbi:MAG: hypothetical protein UU99_C0011G0007 [Parcubacteria group bacterium GW2011_GWE2_42_14]|nr:MAG: hypothetical protein UU99_C0011G0007 [Parcubacteria group bacterium GW2011_GWE2_42_14]
MPKPRSEVDWQKFAIPKSGKVRLKAHKYRIFKQKMHDRDGNQCLNLTLHHTPRRSQGGKDIPEHVSTVCLGCHDLIEKHIISDQFCKDNLILLYGMDNENIRAAQ